MQHTSFVHFFAVVLHDYNTKLPSYTFYGGTVVRVLVYCFFSLPLFFTLVAASISHFLTAATRFLCFSSNKKCLLWFLSLALALCRPFSRSASLACCLLSLFLCLSLVEMTINLSLILQTTRIQIA